MTSSPHEHDHSEKRDGLGEPVTGMPNMAAPDHRATWATPPQPIVPSHLPMAPPPAPAPVKDRTAWYLTGGLGLIVVIGLIVAVIAIPNAQEDDPLVDGDNKTTIQCEPPEKPVDSDPLTAESFYKSSWEAKYDDSIASAELLGVWDHVDCCDVATVTVIPALNEAECGYAIESAYESEDGHMRLGQLVLVFANTNDALAAEAVDFTGFKFAPESGYYETDVDIYGISEAIGRYMIVTIGAIDSEDEQILSDNKILLSTFHGDHALALIW